MRNSHLPAKSVNSPAISSGTQSQAATDLANRSRPQQLSKDKGILLESGTNEVEILEFHVSHFRLGINVAKVREILMDQTITATRGSHPAHQGSFVLRNKILSAFSLHRYFNEPQPQQTSPKIIVCEFNQHTLGYLVDDVRQIHRISWDRVQPLPPLLYRHRIPVTSLVEINGSLISLLDFESIASQMAPSEHLQQIQLTHAHVHRDEIRVLLVDDSPTVRDMVATTYRHNGFKHLFAAEDGQRAWDWLMKNLQSSGQCPVDLIVSDVEMPRMDGFRLTREVRNHPQLHHLPVVLFSSIMTPGNFKKGAAVGATAQITKPELSRVVELTDSLMATRSPHFTANGA